MSKLDKEDGKIEKADLRDAQPPEHIAPVGVTIVGRTAEGDDHKQDE